MFTSSVIVTGGNLETETRRQHNASPSRSAVAAREGIAAFSEARGQVSGRSDILSKSAFVGHTISDQEFETF